MPLESDIESAINSLSSLREDVSSFYKQASQGCNIDWSSLDWSKKGPASVFNQLKIAGAWVEFMTSNLLQFETRRNEVVVFLDSARIQIEKDYEAALKKNARSNVIAGFAYQERAAFAKIDVGDVIYTLAVADKALEAVNASLLVLRTKIKLISDFKNEAKLATTLLNFGNVIGEL
jgi:hypothetical protein